MHCLSCSSLSGLFFNEKVPKQSSKKNLIFLTTTIFLNGCHSKVNMNKKLKEILCTAGKWAAMVSIISGTSFLVAYIPHKKEQNKNKIDRMYQQAMFMEYLKYSSDTAIGDDPFALEAKLSEKYDSIRAVFDGVKRPSQLPK